MILGSEELHNLFCQLDPHKTGLIPYKSIQQLKKMKENESRGKKSRFNIYAPEFTEKRDNLGENLHY